MSLNEKLRNIKLVILDVDGVLTDGSLNISGNGEEFKTFYVRDGLGIKFLQDAGIQVAICTGRTSAIVRERARELGITQVMQGEKDKREGFARICESCGIRPDEAAYMGDDIPDLCLFPLVGLSCAPNDAHPIVRGKVEWVSKFNGGRGAVRELAETILTAQDQLKFVVEKRFKTEL
jgi:3-deoxy-D-manno-octulosonate 8-phosphate phosphatase (KDO 8-P phosphatase)